MRGSATVAVLQTSDTLARAEFAHRVACATAVRGVVARDDFAARAFVATFAIGAVVVEEALDAPCSGVAATRLALVIDFAQLGGGRVLRRRAILATRQGPDGHPTPD